MEAINSDSTSNTENAAPIASNQADNEQKGKRTLLAVGDLHGDYHRLIRHLREMELLLPDTLAWNPEQNKVDLILIGDYVDWRGEDLEFPMDQSPTDGMTGTRKILELLFILKKELTQLRKQDPTFESFIYPLLGNHDEMMLDAMSVFKFISVEDFYENLNKTKSFGGLRRLLGEKCLSGDQIEQVARFVNWYAQGGEQTMRGFGGMQSWKTAMEGELGIFLRDNLHLAIIVNDRLFAHSVPDVPRFWKPVEELAALPEEEYAQAREAFMWGRKVWGYDYNSSTRTSAFQPTEIQALLTGLQCKSVVIGHTPLSRGTEYITAYDGKVTNIDLHGTPGASAFIEKYTPTAMGTRAPLRSELVPQAINSLA